jgi:hypothetical protein
MTGLGSALGVWCVVMLPSAYRFQEKFNGRREQRQKMEKQSRTTKLNVATSHPSPSIPLPVEGRGKLHMNVSPLI